MGAPCRRHDCNHLNGRPNVDLKYCTSSVSEHINVHARTHTHTHERQKQTERESQKDTQRQEVGKKEGSHLHNSCSVTNQLQRCSQGAKQC